jgi:hypothetical protein
MEIEKRQLIYTSTFENQDDIVKTMFDSNTERNTTNSGGIPG